MVLTPTSSGIVQVKSPEGAGSTLMEPPSPTTSTPAIPDVPSRTVPTAVISAASTTLRLSGSASVSSGGAVSTV